MLLLTLNGVPNKLLTVAVYYLDSTSMDSETTEEPSINDTGFTVLQTHEDVIADVVFVHGLQGHPRKTWTCEVDLEQQSSSESNKEQLRRFKKLFSRVRNTGKKDASKPKEVFWPLHFLSEDCPDSRILTWGYDSNVSHFLHGAANQSNITAYARNLLAALKVIRLSCQKRGLIFVAHSLGGIIVKDLLCRAAIDADPLVYDIHSSTEAILFLGTPHRGSSKAGLAEVVRKIVSVSGFDTSDRNIRALQINSFELESIHEHFMRLYEKKDRHFKALTFQEAKGVVGTSYLKLNERVVEPNSSSITSAEPTQTINANHMEMCRFQSKASEGYNQILGEISVVMSDIRRKGTKRVNESIKLRADSSSQTTTSSLTYSLNEVERKCIAILAQNVSNAAEYKSSLPGRVEGTCCWILSHPQYRDWYAQTETCLLWISGYPGSGKTILSAYLLEYLGAPEFTLGLRSTLCYFFCDEKIEKQRDSKTILRSLIHQLITRRRPLIKYVKTAYEMYGPHFDQNLDGLWRILIAIASDKLVGPITVIVDAIDECEERTRERFLQDVVKLIERSKAKTPQNPCIKFIVTSRPPSGRQYTAKIVQIDPSLNDVEQDLRLVIRTKVEVISQRTRCKPEVKEYLENALYSKADRTFLWVTLVLHHLEKSFLASQKDFKRIIDELPKTLSTTYEKLLGDISTQYQPLAAKLLHLLIASSRPLTLDEMQILVAIQSIHCSIVDVEEETQPNIQKTLEGVLGSLVRIWDGRVYLVHQSLKEYLLTLSDGFESALARTYGINQHKADLLLANSCVSYLMLEDFNRDLFLPDHLGTEDSPTSIATDPTEKEWMDNPWSGFDLEECVTFKDPIEVDIDTCAAIRNNYALFDYAARHWAAHFASASPVSSPDLRRTVLQLLDAKTCRGSNWLRYYWRHNEPYLPYPLDFDTIVTASYFGHSIVLEELLSDGLGDTDTGIPGMYWASRMGHSDVLELLLQASVDPDTIFADGHTALTTATQFNRIHVVQRLLEDEGFIPELNAYRVNHAAIGGRTPLSIAASNGFLDIVGQLLQHSQIQPEIGDSSQWTPLFWSINGKNLDVFKMLLSHSMVSVNHVDRSGRNILSWAAAYGEVELVRILIGLKNLKAHDADRDGRTALSWAAENGHLEVTRMLRRSMRIDVSSVDKDGRNAISWACSGGHHTVVDYLIKHNPKEVDNPDVDGWTPLSWALFRQAPETVKTLLRSELVDVNRKDRNGRSALSFAVGYGYLAIVEILLSAEGIEIDSEDNDGRTPMSHASRYPDIVKILQEFNR